MDHVSSSSSHHNMNIYIYTHTHTHLFPSPYTIDFFSILQLEDLTKVESMTEKRFTSFMKVSDKCMKTAFRSLKSHVLDASIQDVGASS